jgi:hypothetical protein
MMIFALVMGSFVLVMGGIAALLLLGIGEREQIR